MQEDNRIDIAVCGDGGCGKSSLILRLVRDQWVSEYDPTIEDSYSITREIDGRTWYLHICDTAGQEEYRSLFSRSTLQADAFLLVYDITSRPTLDSLSHFTTMVAMEAEERKYRTNVGGKSPVAPVKMVAGNKCDLTDLREVAKQDGHRWAKERRCGFLETSARDVVNVEEVFATIVRRVADARRLNTTGKPVQYSASAASFFPTSSTTTTKTSHIASSTVLPLNASSLAYLNHDPVPYVQNPTRALTPINASELSEKRTLAGGGALPQHRSTYSTTNKNKSSRKARNVSRHDRHRTNNRTAARYTDQYNNRNAQRNWSGSEKSRWFDDESDDEQGKGLWANSTSRKKHRRQRSGTTNTSTAASPTTSGGYSGYSGSDGRAQKRQKGRDQQGGFLSRLFRGLSCF